jgi:hypothetical protein
MKIFGAKRRKLPMAAIANSNDVSNLAKYKGGDFSAEKLSEFASKWERGELTMSKKLRGGE